MSTPQYTAQELGYPQPPSPPPGDLPPGDGRFAIPNFLSFAGLVTTAARTYKYTTDEALNDSVCNARAMRRDAVLWSALRARQRPTAQLSWHIEPHDDTDPAEVEAAAIVTKCIEAIPRFQKMKMSLLEALWFGKAGVELAWSWREDIIPGEKILGVRDWLPINGDKIRFKWDRTPGILVYGGFPGTWEATDWGMAHFLTPSERQQFIIHEHEPEDVDWMEPGMAGAIHGVGLRGRLYWFWWLKQQVFALLMNYLERFSNGLTIFYYPAHDDAALQQAQQAASQQFSQTALLYPRWNSEKPDANSIERLEVGTASPALLQDLVTSYFDMVMVRAIRGESPYVGPEGGARGGGDMAELASEGLDETVKYDAVDLGETFQTDLVEVLYRYNAPGVRPGKFSFEVDTPNAQEVLKYAEALFEMGLGLDGDQLYELGQLKKPAPGSEVVSKLGAMQAAAVGSAPDGMPVSGQPGAAGPPMGPQDPQMVADYQAQAGPPPAVPAGGGEGAPLAYNRGSKSRLPRRRLTFAK